MGNFVLMWWNLHKHSLSRCKTLFWWAFSNVSQQTLLKTYTLSHHIHSAHSWNAFSCVHSTFCAFFYHCFIFVSYMAAKATLQLTVAALCWSNNIVAERFSTAVMRELFTCRKAIYQTGFDSLYALRKTHYPR